MSSSLDEPAQTTSEEKLTLLKRAYRALKEESERREATMQEERASMQRERGALLAQIKVLTRDLDGLKESVRRAGAEARERLLANGEPLGRFSSGAGACPGSVASSSGCSSAHSAGGGGSEGVGSYQKGREWAARVLHARDALTSALSTSLESVQGLAVPASVQAQLARQAALLDDHAAHSQALWLQLSEARAAVAAAHATTRAESDRADAATGQASEVLAVADEAEARRADAVASLAAVRGQLAAAVAASQSAAEAAAAREAEMRAAADAELADLRVGLAEAWAEKRRVQAQLDLARGSLGAPPPLGAPPLPPVEPAGGEPSPSSPSAAAAPSVAAA
ncbi:hypothetical protein EMIHUDRAFT_459632, partial [Emiliania huxleyi CCMP1516]|uniref:Uncharacterized protein n=2 Tax=Emiliania huxleyi TaxID=2903 RepID=A0A0D3INE6_EMIH1